MRLTWRCPVRRDKADDQAALEAAERHLARVRDQWPQIHEDVNTMNRYRELNNFTRKIRAAMGVGQ